MKTITETKTVRGFVDNKSIGCTLEELAQDMLSDVRCVDFDEDCDGKGEDRLNNVNRVEVTVSIQIKKLPRG